MKPAVGELDDFQGEVGRDGEKKGEDEKIGVEGQSADGVGG